MIDRRNLLRGALLGAGMSAFSGRVLASTGRALGSTPTLTPQPDYQLLFVFQRGGNDGVNTLIPHLDPSYAGTPTIPSVRPSLAITNGIALAGQPYSRLNPDLGRLVPIDQANDLALIHQVGDGSASRSHFTAMDMFEKAQSPSNPPTQQQLAQATGFVPKMLAQASIPPYDSNLRPAALSLSPLMQTMFSAGNSAQVSGHVRDLAAPGFPALMQAIGIDQVSKQHAADHAIAPAHQLDGQLGYELAFGHETSAALRLLNFVPAFATTGRFPLSAAQLAAAGAATGSPIVPAFDGKGAAFMAAAEQAVYTLVNSPKTRVVGIEIGGWDTHAAQAPDHANLLRYLGWGLRDMYDAIAAASLLHRITIVVVSEFGRTAYENGSQGTDHGVGGAYFALGEGVRGGSHNIHSGTPGAREYGQPWRRLDSPTPMFADAVDVRTELRDVLAELMVKRIGVPIANLPNVMPGYPASNAGFLGFLL